MSMLVVVIVGLLPGLISSGGVTAQLRVGDNEGRGLLMGFRAPVALSLYSVWTYGAYLE